MSEKTLNLLKALFCFILVIGCVMTLILKTFGTDQKYPYIGIVLGGFLTVAFLRRAFED